MLVSEIIAIPFDLQPVQLSDPIPRLQIWISHAVYDSKAPAHHVRHISL